MFVNVIPQPNLINEFSIGKYYIYITRVKILKVKTCRWVIDKSYYHI